MIKTIFQTNIKGINWTNTKEDHCTYGVFIPELHFLLFNKHIESPIDHPKIQQWFNLHEFIDLCIQGDIIAISLLHQSVSNFNLTPEWAWLRQHKELFYSHNIVSYTTTKIKQLIEQYDVDRYKLDALHRFKNRLLKHPQGCTLNTLIKSTDIVTQEIYPYIQLERIADDGSMIQKLKIDTDTYCYLTITISELVDKLKSLIKKYTEYKRRSRMKYLRSAILYGYITKEFLETAQIITPLSNAPIIQDLLYNPNKLSTQTIINSAYLLIDDISRLAQNTTLLTQPDIKNILNKVGIWFMELYHNQYNQKYIKYIDKIIQDEIKATNFAIGFMKQQYNNQLVELYKKQLLMLKRLEKEVLSHWMVGKDKSSDGGIL